MGINWAAILPYLIGAGSSAAGQIIGGKIQAGASDRAAELGYQSGQDQLNALINMWGLERGDRAPMRAVGLNALDTLQNWKPGATNALKPVDLSKYQPNQIDIPPELGSLAKPGTNAFSPPNYEGTSTAGVGGNKLINMASFGLNKAWDTNNPDKNVASSTVNQLSNWTWNTLAPQLKSGRITPEQAEQSFNNAWNQWEQTLRTVPNMDKGVIDKSISSQRQYFQPFYDLVNQMKQGQGQTA